MTEQRAGYKAGKVTSDFEYTPGPWWVERGKICKIITGEPGGEIGAAADLGNAVLMAESPRLYEAALRVLAAAGAGGAGAEEIDALRKVVWRVGKMQCVIK